MKKEVRNGNFSHGRLIRVNLLKVKKIGIFKTKEEGYKSSFKKAAVKNAKFYFSNRNDHLLPRKVL